MLLCIGQLHPITIYRTVFWVCLVLVLRVIMCSFLNFIDRVLFHHDGCDLLVYSWPLFLFWITRSCFQKVSSSGSANVWMFPPLDIPSKYWIEHVTFGLFYAIFRVSIMIFCRGIPGYAIDCPCGVWCRGLTTSVRWPTFWKSSFKW